MLKRTASWSARHPVLVIIAWLVAIVGAIAAAGSVGGSFADSGRLEGTDSDDAYQLYGQHFPDDPAESAMMVFENEGGLATEAAAIEAFIGRLSVTPGVTEAGSPFDPDVPGARISADGTIGTSAVGFDATDPAVIDRIAAEADELRATGTEVDFSSFWFRDGGVPASEGFGLLAAMVILLLAFGSVVAMGLPVVTAIAGIAIGLAGVELWAAVMPTPDFTVQVASMVGIGVGIDYALFIVTRYREALRRTGDVHESIVEAIDTAGRAVLFAGLTVMISLLGMFLMGLSFLYGLAVGTSSAVLVAVAAALTLLPALLALVGTRIDRFSIHRRAERTGESRWHQWSRLVQRHPSRFAIGGLSVLVALSVPTLSMRQAAADLGVDPVGTTTRTAYDRVSKAFGPGVNGPLILVARTPDAAALDRFAAATAQLASLEGVADMGSPIASPDGQAAIVQVVPTTGPQDEATTRLVGDLRSQSSSQFDAASGIKIHVGGSTASDVDFAERMSSRLPVFIGAVLALSFLLLMIVFRSLVVPLKAVALNLLSIGAAYGVMVMVFQWGWLGGLIGVHEGAPIEPWAPMMLFAIVFGLSMDYEVFLLSSVKERVDAGMANSHAVVEGLASTARVITAGAAIMVCVFGSFVLGDDRAIKLIGLGLSVAVFIDATVVRMVLVPATMELFGERNWWLPKRLARALPRLRLAEAG
jgi:putative drug exporter of the RND superfamily